MHMHPCMRAYATVHGAETYLIWKLLQSILTVQKLLYYGNYCELSWVFCNHCAGCCLPYAHLLSRRKRSPDTACSRKHSQSMLAHDAIAAALSHKHHPIIHIGVGPIQMVYASHSRLAAKLTHNKIRFPPSRQLVCACIRSRAHTHYLGYSMWRLLAFSVSYFGGHDRLHLESSNQNYCSMSLYAKTTTVCLYER